MNTAASINVNAWPLAAVQHFDALGRPIPAAEAAAVVCSYAQVQRRFAVAGCALAGAYDEVHHAQFMATAIQRRVSLAWRALIGAFDTFDPVLSTHSQAAPRIPTRTSKTVVHWTQVVGHPSSSLISQAHAAAVSTSPSTSLSCDHDAKVSSGICSASGSVRELICLFEQRSIASLSDAYPAPSTSSVPSLQGFKWLCVSFSRYVCAC